MIIDQRAMVRPRKSKLVRKTTVPTALLVEARDVLLALSGRDVRETGCFNWNLPNRPAECPCTACKLHRAIAAAK